MPDDQLFLTDLLAQEQPDPKEVVKTVGEYVASGMFIHGDTVNPNLAKIPFSLEQLESMVVMLGAAIDTYKRKHKLIHEYGRVKDELRIRIERIKYPNGNGASNGQ